jgi:hypothetical protein
VVTQLGQDAGYATGRPETAIRQRLLPAVAGMAALSHRGLSELDWQRLLDAVVFAARD